MKLSIIIPVYNLEKFISRCIDSVLNQDLALDEFEILFINDGSTDKSQHIINEYITKNTNLHLYNKKNGGVSSARNFGLEKAKGEYVLFVDGDDWLETNTLNKLYTDTKKNSLEISRFGYNSVLEEKITKEFILKNTPKPITGINFIINSDLNEFHPWAYLLSREFLLKNKLLFNVNLSYCEDKEFMVKALSLAEKFQNFNYVHYNYRIMREGSATAIYSNKNLHDLIKANIIIFEFSDTIMDKNYKMWLKSISVKSLELSYYSLTTQSLWHKFWVWQKNIKSHKTFNNHISNSSLKLSILNKNAFIFYLFYYFPRAMYHKILN